jgi:hypothetical protein
VLQKGWRKIYSYVKDAPEPEDFEKFYVALMRKSEKISADGVAINYGYAGHSMTERAKSYARKCGKKVIYISGSSEEQLLTRLYKEYVLPREAVSG